MSGLAWDCLDIPCEWKMWLGKKMDGQVNKYAIKGLFSLCGGFYMLFLQHCCISLSFAGISLCTALLRYHHSILELWSGLWLGQGNTFILFFFSHSFLDLLLRLRSFSKYIPPHIQTITFDSRILCYTKEFMVSLLHRCCECEISPNHYLSTPVLDSWCEVIFSTLDSSIQNTFSRSVVVCSSAALQTKTILPCSF